MQRQDLLNAGFLAYSLILPTDKFTDLQLTYMNDGRRPYQLHTFNEIADILEGKMEPKTKKRRGKRK